MKLAVTQTVLGLLVTLTACVIVGWMLFGAPALLTMPMPDASGASVMTRVIPRHETLFTAARYTSGLLLVLGLTVLSFSFFQRPRAEGSKAGMAAVQVASGVLIAAGAVFISTWGYPIVYTAPVPESGNIIKSVNILPAPPMTGVIFLTAVTVPLGVGVLGVGIAQLVRVRRAGI